MAHDRDVGGIRCLEVLEQLAAYLDGDVADELRARIEAHVKECDWCARFGGQYASTVAHLREVLAAPEPLDAEVEDRLARRLLEELEK